MHNRPGGNKEGEWGKLHAFSTQLQYAGVVLWKIIYMCTTTLGAALVSNVQAPFFSFAYFHNLGLFHFLCNIKTPDSNRLCIRVTQKIEVAFDTLLLVPK